ncbi:MAG: MarR family transcriptional regulator [Anaerolineae bacterium]|nr:MarR family transcriptional regulator [Anaerolineae bacterium]
MNEPDQALYTETIHTFLTLYRYLRRYSCEMQSQGLSGRKIAALRYLLEAGARSIGQLRDYLYINDSSTSELVTQLEQAGYITRVRSSADNRVVLVTLTSTGKEVAQSVPLGGIPLLRERLKTLPPERLALIHTALSELKELLGIADES